MENASKALLIAGSVLIAILVIALGVKVFNSTAGMNMQTEESMATMEVTMFNNKFTSYIGINKSKAEVKSLLNQVITNNTLKNGHIISVSFNSSGTDSSSSSAFLNKVIVGEALKEEFADKKVFTILVGYNSSGYVNLIKIY